MHVNLIGVLLLLVRLHAFFSFPYRPKEFKMFIYNYKKLLQGGQVNQISCFETPKRYRSHDLSLDDCNYLSQKQLIPGRLVKNLQH